HEMHVFRVKAPGESRGPYDYYERVATIPPAQAFRPLDQGGEDGTTLAEQGYTSLEGSRITVSP
ncbi:MAG TPA: hypothetical protein VFE90_14485, partial [Myxococcales bacterium]|nr:hypothetical protein [Myxococcales bacterium]